MTSTPTTTPSSSSDTTTLSSGTSSSAGSTNTSGSGSRGTGSDVLPSSLTDTVPTRNSDSPPEDEPEVSKVWGVLYPALGVSQHLYKVISLDYDGEYVVGRDSSCHYKVELTDGFDRTHDLTVLFSNISKKHFNIFREKDESTDGYSVKLTDLSSNGTFVNRLPVGKGKTVDLNNCSTIALADMNN